MNFIIKILDQNLERTTFGISGLSEEETLEKCKYLYNLLSSSNPEFIIFFGCFINKEDDYLFCRDLVHPENNRG